MTEPSEPPSAGRDTPYGTPPTSPPNPYPYQPPPGPAGYPQPPSQPYSGYPPAPPQQYSGYPPQSMGPRNGMGTASLVVAILALLSSWSVVGGIILGLAALVIGLVARGRVKRGEATNGGVAIAGIVLGVLALVVGVACIPAWAYLWKDVGGSDYVSCLQQAGSDAAKQQQCEQQFQQHLDNQFSITPTPPP